MVEQHEVAKYLLDRGLLTPKALLDGDLAVTDASSRNRNFRVETTRGPCYFVKQGLTAESQASVAYEASVYAQLARAQADLQACLPRFVGYDHEQGVLLLGLVRDAEDLRSLHLGTASFSARPAFLLGSALGMLHRSAAQASGTSLPAIPPWILSVHRPDARVFRDISAASLEVISVVQEEARFADALDGLRRGWRVESTIHGDVKWDNCLLYRGDDGSEGLCLVDFEAAVAGDPCWDIGSALSHYLSFWVFSMPAAEPLAPESFAELARYPLDAMKPALSACWAAYADRRRFDTESWGDELERAVAYAGARLVQSAFEAAQLAQQMSRAVVLQLQLALNILTRPQAAAAELLGLARRDGAAA
jgi:Ser/Thr protein kinase RdoA (MazF antagonist)